MELRTVLLIVGIGVLGVVVAGSYRAIIADFMNRLLAKFRGKIQLSSFQSRTRNKRARKKNPQLVPVADFQQGFDFDESVDLVRGGDDSFYNDSEPVIDNYQFPTFKPHDLEADTLDIDFGAIISGDDPVARDDALGIFRQHEYELEKPLRIHARSVETGDWRDLEQEPEAGEYSELALSLQLSDRHGPATETDLTKFSSLVLRLSEDLGRTFKFTMSIDDALERAFELQNLCKEFDTLVVLNVIANEGLEFHGRVIDQCAAEFGLELGRMNIYHKTIADVMGPRNLYSMANLLSPGNFDPQQLDDLRTQGLSLFMSLPTNYQPADVFLDMAHTARSISERLNGQLTDRDQNPLSERGINAIHQQILNYVADLRSEGIVAGGRLASRLF
ncbi:MAG: cell division protein ZipA C-terminal FtsZ-binding domain-containing protein [Gammaproteobacteria bacterium]|nr:cell division protein ZipA C-terminal FtsZ-binding domain-containing protein [Gammaproteobacteria bacterium]